MHLKTYVIDGALLRTRSANFSPSGLKQQDNDLIILRDPVLAAKFEARFAEIYRAAEKEDDVKNGGSKPECPEPPPNPACPIKGNINAKGECIFHEPGTRDYCRVSMKDCDEHGACAKGKPRVLFRRRGCSGKVQAPKEIA